MCTLSLSLSQKHLLVPPAESSTLWPSLSTIRVTWTQMLWYSSSWAENWGSWETNGRQQHVQRGMAWGLERQRGSCKISACYSAEVTHDLERTPEFFLEFLIDSSQIVINLKSQKCREAEAQRRGRWVSKGTEHSERCLSHSTFLWLWHESKADLVMNWEASISSDFWTRWCEMERILIMYIFLEIPPLHLLVKWRKELSAESLFRLFIFECLEWWLHFHLWHWYFVSSLFFSLLIWWWFS